MTDLIARIERAGPEEQRELIEEAKRLLHPKPGGSCIRKHIQKMLDAGAYLDAVLLMKPDGAILHIFIFPHSASVLLFRNEEDENEERCHASTPALALLAAILRAVKA